MVESCIRVRVFWTALHQFHLFMFKEEFTINVLLEKAQGGE